MAGDVSFPLHYSVIAWERAPGKQLSPRPALCPQQLQSPVLGAAQQRLSHELGCPTLPHTDHSYALHSLTGAGGVS